MPTRRELMERAEMRLRARGGDEEGLEATRCFLRAMLMGESDDQPVSDALVGRIAEFLKLDPVDLSSEPPPRRTSTRPPPSLRPNPERRRRVLFLARGDAARIAMFEAVARATMGDEEDVRAASVAPVAYDARALRVLRHAGYASEGIVPRAMSVDDLSWADMVVTVGGEKEDWERFIPRSIAHEHELVEDPIPHARALGDVDELDAFRAALRSVERIVASMRAPRSTRVSLHPSSGRIPRFDKMRPEQPGDSRTDMRAVTDRTTPSAAAPRLQTPPPYRKT